MSFASKFMITSSWIRFHSSLEFCNSRHRFSKSFSLLRSWSNSTLRGPTEAFSCSCSLRRVSSSCSMARAFFSRERFSSSRSPSWPSLMLTCSSSFTSDCNLKTSLCSVVNRLWSSATSPRRVRNSNSKRALSPSSSLRRCTSASRMLASSASRLKSSPLAPVFVRAIKCSWYFWISEDKVSARRSSCSRRLRSVCSSSSRSTRALSAPPSRSCNLLRRSFASLSSLSRRSFVASKSEIVKL
mmetsp:Transcript_28486/g.61925  ORF Transcript_28486/g.61925 Transcript_28486/m.61925 type:complete len:242 (+) Transcript_28486:1791-2516(+)